MTAINFWYDERKISKRNAVRIGVQLHSLLREALFNTLLLRFTDCVTVQGGPFDKEACIKRVLFMRILFDKDLALAERELRYLRITLVRYVHDISGVDADLEISFLLQEC